MCYSDEDMDLAQEGIERDLIQEFLDDLNNIKYVDVARYDKMNFPEFYIKVYDINQIKEKWEKKIAESNQEE